MLKRAKEQYQTESWKKHYSGNAGFRAELALSCDEEYIRLIRGRRRTQQLRDNASFICFSEKNRSKKSKSWKARCRKRHQWEKHRAEEDVRSYYTKKDRFKAAHTLWSFLQSFPSWVKLDIRNNPEWEYGVEILIDQKKIECVEKNKTPFLPYNYPVLTVRILEKAPVAKDAENIIKKQYRQSDLKRHHTGKSGKKPSFNNNHSKRPQIEKEESRQSPSQTATPLLHFYESLPRSIRRKWRYRMWEPVVNRHDTNALDNYIALLNSALRSGVKIMFVPYDPRNNPYANLLWNMSVSDSVNIESTSSNHVYNAELQLKLFLNKHCRFFALPEWVWRLCKTKIEKTDLDSLRAWSFGKSPREILGLSKHENGYFHNLPASMPSLNFALTYCVALAKHCDKRLSLVLAKALHERGNSVYSVYLQRSRLLVEWFNEQEINNLGDVGDLIDYFYQKNRFSSDISLKGRTLKSMMREMNLWHRELYGVKIGYHTWPKQGFSYIFGKNKVIFDEINNSKQLQDEGCKQRHCVVTYLNRCLKKKCAIVAMNALDGSMNLTLEINLARRCIVQAKGKRNTNTSKQEDRCIRRYAREKNLQYDCVA